MYWDFYIECRRTAQKKQAYFSYTDGIKTQQFTRKRKMRRIDTCNTQKQQPQNMTQIDTLQHYMQSPEDLNLFSKAQVKWDSLPPCVHTVKHCRLFHTLNPCSGVCSVRKEMTALPKFIHLFWYENGIKAKNIFNVLMASKLSYKFHRF